MPAGTPLGVLKDLARTLDVAAGKLSALLWEVVDQGMLARDPETLEYRAVGPGARPRLGALLPAPVRAAASNTIRGRVDNLQRASKAVLPGTVLGTVATLAGEMDPDRFDRHVVSPVAERRWVDVTEDGTVVAARPAREDQPAGVRVRDALRARLDHAPPGAPIGTTSQLAAELGENQQRVGAVLTDLHKTGAPVRWGPTGWFKPAPDQPIGPDTPLASAEPENDPRGHQDREAVWAPVRSFAPGTALGSVTDAQVLGGIPAKVHPHIVPSLEQADVIRQRADGVDELGDPAAAVGAGRPHAAGGDAPSLPVWQWAAAEAERIVAALGPGERLPPRLAERLGVSVDTVKRAVYPHLVGRGLVARTTRGYVKAVPVEPEPRARAGAAGGVVEVGPVQAGAADPGRALRSVRDEIVSAAARRPSVFSAPADVAEVVDLEPASSEVSEPASPAVEAPGDRSDVRGRPAPPAPGGLG